jgi:nitrate/TMAO reductase-like tetraheme cytochrome c subunit
VVKSAKVDAPTLTATEAAQAHGKLFLEKRFPSATTCGVCHPDHFREWSVSSHAYAQLSPVFNAMQSTIVKETSGTNGDFCIRCHTQVGMQLKEPVLMTNLDRDPASREGITCIVCHRISQPYGKVSGRTSIVEGDVFEPIYGPTGNKNLKQVIAQADDFKVVTERGKPGRGIHGDAIKFETISTSAFCGQCHDVNLLNGFRLEEAFSQFKNSPANKAGTTCQDCHMGVTPGLKSGYANAPAANIGGKTTPPRKRTNHMFAGPDYSVVHPGMFPHNGKAQELATLREWLQFDYEAGWGTDAFEKKIAAGTKFPDRWKSVDDRYDARTILNSQFDLLNAIKAQRYQILRRGYQLGELVVQKNDAQGLRFQIEIRNGTDGHGVSTGFDAERLSFAQVTVTDADGRTVFVSGDRDPNGDVRDLHSAYVHNEELPLDRQLFSLQSKFITRNLRGGEREQLLAVNYSVDPLPYIRPDTTPGILIARPGGARKQARILPPLSSRFADYEVPKENLTGRTPYTVNVRLIAQMVPVNLLREIADVGLDYNLTPRKVADRIVGGAHVLWDRTVELPAAANAKVDLRATEQEILAPPHPGEKSKSPPPMQPVVASIKAPSVSMSEPARQP